MFIQTESTPNPATIKFLPGCVVMVRGSADFTNAEAATRSPLATRLFAQEGVIAVFLGNDFIAVTKAAETDWAVLKTQILAVIMDHYASGEPVMLETAEASGADDDAIVTQIKELLETRVRPAVAQDGGDIVFHSFKDGIVYLEMRGACQGCPSSSATLKHGVENMLKYYIPEIVAVEQA